MISGNAKPHSLIAALSLALWISASVGQTTDTLSQQALEEISRAEEYWETGDLRAAIVGFKNALQQHPENAVLRYRIGLLYLDAGNGLAAERSLERARELGMDQQDNRLALGRAWFLLGKHRDILRELHAESARTPSARAAVSLLRGKAQLQLGEPEAAIDSFRAALTALPEYSPAFARLAMLSISEKDLDKAEIFLKGAEQGVEADPAAIKWLQGQLEYERGNYATAETAFQDSLSLEPGKIERRRDLGATQIQLGSFAEADENFEQVLEVLPDDLGTLYFQSLSAYLQEEYERAAELASQVAARSLSPRAMFIAGASSYRIGNDEQARDYLSRFVALDSDDLAGRVYLAQTLLRMGDASEANSVLFPVENQSAGNVRLLTLLGNAAFLSGERSKGMDYLRQALELRPLDVRLRARVAAAQVAAGDPESGIAEFERLAAEDTEAAGLEFSLARAYLQARRFDDAIAAARRQQSKGEGLESFALTLEGFALLGKGALDGAETAFGNVLELRPDNADAQVGLAEIKRVKGDIPGARKIMEAQLDTHPDPNKAILNRAVLESKIGNSEQAIALLERGVRSYPEDVELKVAVVGILGQEGRALDALNLLDSWPDDDSLLQARGRMELLIDRPNDAVATLRRLVESRPESVGAHLLLAKAYERSNELENAAETLEAALALDPQRVETRVARDRFTLIHPDVNQELHSQVQNDVLDLAEAFPRDPNIGELRGLLSWRQSQSEEALALLKSVHTVLDTAESARVLADILWQAGKKENALATMDDWVTRHPKSNYGRVHLATLQLGAGELQGAARNLEEAMQAGAWRQDLESVLAWALVQTGKVAEAKPYALEAYAASKRNPFALHAMGRVYLEEGKAVDAVNLLHQAMEAAVPDQRLRLDYARALGATGRRKEAKVLLDELLSEDAAFVGRHEAVELRKRLDY